MKLYYYLLFRLYTFYTITLKRKDQPLLNVAIVSAILILLNLISFYSILKVYQLIPKIKSDIYYLIFVFGILIINYLFFVKKERFLQYHFKRDKLGGVLVSLFILTTLVIFIITTDRSRKRTASESKIFKKQIKTSN